MLQRGNKIVGGSLHVKAIVGMIIILDITDLLKAKYFLLHAYICILQKIKNSNLRRKSIIIYLLAVFL